MVGTVAAERPEVRVAMRFLVCVVLALAGLAPSAARAQETKPNRAALFALQDAFTSIAEELEPTVVTITARKTVHPRATAAAPDKPDKDDDLFQGLPFGHPRVRAFRSEGTGSGVIIDPSGWILTNDHVVMGADRVVVKLHDGREFDGTVRRDFRSDLALVKINASDLHAAHLGDSQKLKIGQWAIAIGSPYRYEGSFSVGVISSLYRHQEIPGGSDLRIYPNLIQTDAAINPGNSGGPLVNVDGEVIGINTAIETDTGGSVGIGFAIPIEVAKYVVPQLEDSGHVTYGYLGVMPATLTPKLATAYRVSSGAQVQNEPDKDSPAGKAGIHADDVITDIDGQPVRNEQELRTIVSRIVPGKTVEVVLVRDGVEKHVKVTIAEAPAVGMDERPAKAAASTGLGIDVKPITPEAIKQFNLDEKATGIFVKSIDTTSPVSETELTVGDIVLKVNGVPTPTVEAFHKAIEGLKSGDIVRIVWKGRRGRETAERVVTYELD